MHEYCQRLLMINFHRLPDMNREMKLLEDANNAMFQDILIAFNIKHFKCNQYILMEDLEYTNIFQSQMKIINKIDE